MSVKTANGGDLKRPEAMLTTQTHTLDAMFNNLARRATNAEHLGKSDRFLRLALRAQSQCRATLETLAAIKNLSPMAFVRQANIAHGPQQINNAETPADKVARARENENPQNELLEQTHDERLDTGKAGAAGGADPAMATVAAIDRSEHGKGQG